jgi:hypothetical protein
LSSTRQSFCRVSPGARQRKVVVTATSDGEERLCRVYSRTLDKGSSFAECLTIWHSTKRAPVGSFASPFVEDASRHSVKGLLPSGGTTTLNKEALMVPRYALFAECYGHCTRQRLSLPSVTLGKVTKNFLFIYFYYSIQTNKIYITYTSQISQNHHIQHRGIYLTKTTNLTSFSQTCLSSNQVSPI